MTCLPAVGIDRVKEIYDTVMVIRELVDSSRYLLAKMWNGRFHPKPRYYSVFLQF